MLRLAGKTAVVTGAGIGIGRSIAQRFSKEGASVLVVDRDTVHGPETVELVRAAGGKAEFVTADTSEFDTGRNIMLAAEKHFGGVDILVRWAPARSGRCGRSIVADDDLLSNFSIRSPKICVNII